LAHTQLQFFIGQYRGNIFFKYITEEYLWDSVIITAVIIAIIYTISFFILYYKKRNEQYMYRIRAAFEDWIISGHLEEDFTDETVVARMKNILFLHTRVVKQLAIDELVNLSTSFSGEIFEKIIFLYLQLGLKDLTMEKLRSKKWYKVTRAIHELYIMKQSDAIEDIFKHVNSSSEEVRMEAQIALVNLQGYEGLEFLNVVEYWLTEWQQMKLMEQLRSYEMNQEVLTANLHTWLKSANNSVVMFALKLVERYQQYAEYDNVQEVLFHADATVRGQAIRTLSSIADSSTSMAFITIFSNETLENKIKMLDYMIEFSTSNDLPFLVSVLEDEENIIKVKAARVLAKCHEKGLQTLETAGQLRPDPYQQIFLHVQKEME
jgi:hypothetical protein